MHEALGGRALRLVAAVLALTACAPATVQPVGMPAADPEVLEAELAAATRPDSPRHVTFSWRLDEAGSTVQGSGVVRFVAPDRIRLDLFGPRGETYLIAALVGDEFRLPPGARGGFQLPEPALLWAALGVLRPPTGAELESATESDTTATLRYRTAGGDAYEFHATRDGGARVRRAERSGRSGVLESVRVEMSPQGEPARATYVERAAYRQLVLEMESIEDVASFPAAIWDPGR